MQTKADIPKLPLKYAPPTAINMGQTKADIPKSPLKLYAPPKNSGKRMPESWDDYSDISSESEYEDEQVIPEYAKEVYGKTMKWHPRDCGDYQSIEHTSPADYDLVSGPHEHQVKTWSNKSDLTLIDMDPEVRLKYFRDGSDYFKYSWRYLKDYHQTKLDKLFNQYKRINMRLRRGEKYEEKLEQLRITTHIAITSIV